jgi:hypothetical protein
MTLVFELAGVFAKFREQQLHVARLPVSGGVIRLLPVLHSFAKTKNSAIWAMVRAMEAVTTPGHCRQTPTTNAATPQASATKIAASLDTVR